MNPHQRYLQAKVKNRNEPKQVMPKSQDLSMQIIRKKSNLDIWYGIANYFFNKPCAYFTFKSDNKVTALYIYIYYMNRVGAITPPPQYFANPIIFE